MGTPLKEIRTNGTCESLGQKKKIERNGTSVKGKTEKGMNGKKESLGLRKILCVIVERVDGIRGLVRVVIT